MNGLCHEPSAARRCGTVGGAFNRLRYEALTACGARIGAPRTMTAVAMSSAVPKARIRSDLGNPRIDNRQRRVGQETAEGDEDRAGAGAAGDQVNVPGPQRIEHQ